MKLDKFIILLLLAIASFPLIGMRITILIIVLFCIAVIIQVIKNKTYYRGNQDWKLLLFLCSYYLIAILSFIFYTSNYSIALKNLETKTAFIVFPVFIYLIRRRLDKNILSKVLMVFTVANIINALYVWILIFNEGFFKILERDNFYNPIFRKIFSETTGAHLPYLGLLFGFSCLILTHHIVKIKSSKKLILVAPIVILLVSMFIFSARMAIFASAVGIIYYLFSFLSKKNVLLVISCSLVISIMISFLSPVKRRILELVNTELVSPNINQEASKANFRYGIYYCSKEILKENWLLGVGLGSVQEKLNNCYEGFSYRNYDDYLEVEYNSHNQYLNAWLTYGILGLGLILFYLGFSFYSSSVLHKSFIIMIALALLTENLFQREIGVMLFAFFNTIFVVLKNKDSMIKS